MADLGTKNIKKGVLKGTSFSDNINIDSNYNGKKVTVKASSGNDVISAEEFGGNLYAYAGLGSDTMYSNNNKNYLYGESGTNTFVIDPMSDATTISAGKGKAIIDLTGFRDEIRLASFFISSSNHDYFSRNKNDLIIKFNENITGNEKSTLTIKDFFKSRGEYIVQYEGASDTVSFDLRELDIMKINIEEQKSSNYTGIRLTETINGDARKNTIKGQDGDDTISSYGGNDKVYGGNGADSISGGDGNDKLYGDAGNDTISGGYGKDTIYGGDGDDSLAGGYENDVIYGGAGDDILKGEFGADKLYGGSGENTYYVNISDNDTIYVEKDSVNKISLNYGAVEIEKSYRSKNDWILENSSGKLTIANYFKNGCPEVEFVNNDTIPAYISYASKGTIKGSSADDSITGSDKADKIYSNGGKDIIDTGAGKDKIYGYMGELLIASDDRNVTVNVADGGQKTLYGKFAKINLGRFIINEAPTFAYKKVGNDLIITINGPTKNTITVKDYFINQYEDSKSDKLNDIQIAYKINNSQFTLTLSEEITSADTKTTINKGCGTVKVYPMPDNPNNQLLLGTDVSFDSVKYSKSGNNLVITKFGGKKDKIIVMDYFKYAYDVSLEGVGKIKDQLVKIVDMSTTNDKKFTAGTFYSENVTDNDLDNLIKTKDGNDHVQLSKGKDTVYAGNGDDEVWAGGKEGNKKFYGEAGNDYLIGGKDNDTLYGGSGNDSINGGVGNDKLYGDSGDDTLFGGDGNDTINGGKGNDIIEGYIGEDVIYGGSGNDTIYGEHEEDTISPESDTIYAGSGNDEIHVGSYDVIKGESGNDTITSQYANNVSNVIVDSGSGNDVITMFDVSSTADFKTKINAGSGNDYLFIGADNNVGDFEINSGSGKDTIWAFGNDIEINAGSGNDEIRITSKSDNIDDFVVQGGSGNDNITAVNGKFTIKDSSGNDTYIVTNMESGNQVKIDDSKGKDVVRLSADRDDILFDMNFEISSKGKILDMKDIDLEIAERGEDSAVIIDDYFGSGCIERIETADGYYITKTQLQNVAQEVAAWLYEGGKYTSIDECYKQGSYDDIAKLEAFFVDANWQK